jgi:membrane fusion protein (multidrug efflux system)
MKINELSIYTLAIVFLLALAAGCEDTGNTEKKSSKSKPHLVETIQAGYKNISYSAIRTGTLQAEKLVNIFNQEEGRITEINYHEGDKAKKNDVLVRLDATLLEAELDKAIATRKQAEEDLAKIVSLVKKKLAARDELTRAKTTLKVAQAEEALLRARLGYFVIHAPFDGIITTRNIEPGDVAPKHTHLLTIIDRNTLITKVSVSELLLSHLAIGDLVTVQIDALGKNTIKGTIQRIHPTIDDRTRQGIVEIKLNEVPAGARAGQLCRVTLSTPAKKSLLLPFSAVHSNNEGNYIYTIGPDKKAKVLYVHTGLRQQATIEIVSGLEPGTTVITRGFLGLKEGKPVTDLTARKVKKKNQS